MVWSLEPGGQWKEKAARLGAALSAGHLLHLTLVLGVSFSSQEDRTSLFCVVSGA